MTKGIKLLFIVLSLAFYSFSGLAQKKAEFNLEKLADGFSLPWAVDVIKENTFLISEKGGSLIYLDLNNKVRKNISGLPKIHENGQGGFLDVKISPDFNQTKKVYFTYSKEVKDDSTTALAYAILDLKKFSLVDQKDIFIAKTSSDKGVHYGSRIAFDDKHVFVTVGDRGIRDAAQDLQAHNGKVIRLNFDGTIPLDNPFVKNKSALPEIYSYGHRNPQGIVYVEGLKKVFVCEHGPRGGDEINEVKAGKNYGWPLVSYGREYWGPKISSSPTKKGIEDPLKYYVPSIAPSSLVYYGKGKLKQFNDKFLLGALKLTHINAVELNGKNEKRYFENLEKRIRHINLEKNGSIVFITDDGLLYRVN